MALSKKPLAFPTIACACVILGNAPTRMVLASPCAQAAVKEMEKSRIPRIDCLLTLVSSDHHGEDAGGIFFRIFQFLATFAGRHVAGNEIGKCCVFENARRRIANVEKNLVERAMRQIAVDQFAKMFGVAERSEGTVDQANDLAETDVGRLAAEHVSALGTPGTVDHAGVLQFEENQLQELFRKSFLIRDVSNLDCALMVMPRQHHHGLQSVQTFLGDFHNV